MTDFLAALGLLFVIEGCLFAAFPTAARQAMMSAAATPEQVLRTIGLCSAVIGVLLIWLIRG
jgi:uncharacterized protein YjeT (DUF2065 family)